MVMVSNDKPSFMQFLRDNGFAESAPEILGNEVRYPFIYKKRKDVAGINSHVIVTPEARAQFEARIAREEYFKQEYVGGRTEYTTHFLAVDGQPMFDSTVEFTFDVDAYVRGVRYEPLETRKIGTPFAGLFHRILNALNYTGTCCFNYKIADDVPKIFEMNPRAGGSLRLDLNPYLDAYLAALAARHSALSRLVRRARRQLVRPPPSPSPSQALPAAALQSQDA